ncbi:MAG: hypothetical protein WBN83_15475 [Desulfoprunum sp.]
MTGDNVNPAVSPGAPDRIRLPPAFSRHLLDANLESLTILAGAIAKRDGDTDSHNFRVTLYAVRLAEQLGRPVSDIQSLIKGGVSARCRQDRCPRQHPAQARRTGRTGIQRDEGPRPVRPRHRQGSDVAHRRRLGGGLAS